MAVSLSPAYVLVAAAYVLMMGLVAATWLYRRFLLRPSPIDPSYQPKVAMLVPMRGMDAEFVEHLEALLALDYDDYEVIFGVADTDDPAYDVLRSLCALHPKRCRVVLAGVPTTCSDKIHNLLACHRAAATDAEILVMVDADVDLHPLLLRRLVSPLRDPAVGVVTGYGWLVATSPTLARTVATMINAAGAVTFWLSNSVWGGTLAIRRATFEALDVPRIWRTVVSEDLTLRNLLRRNGLRIVSISDGLGVSRQTYGWPTYWELLVGQLIVARVYTPAVWWQVVAFHGVTMSAVIYGVLGSLAVAAGWSSDTAPLCALPLPALFMIQGWLVIDGAQRAIRRRGERIPEIAWPSMPLYVIAVAIGVAHVVASATRRWILRRGVLYRLRAPDRTDVIRPGNARPLALPSLSIDDARVGSLRC